MHVELIATDGKIQKRVLWIDVTSNGVYSGYCIKDRDLHTSYHADGNVFIHWLGDEPKKTVTLPPLDKFSGFHQLSATYFTEDISRLHDTPLYSLKRLDAIVSVDTRSYKNGIGCILFMSEPNNYALLGDMVKVLPQDLATEIHTFMKCKPWLSLILHGVRESPTQQPSNRNPST